MGTLSTHVMIGPVIYSILFQVLRIQSSFNLLLGRPWIHEAGAIPSSLHQKPGRDLKMMSRPQVQQPRSRRQSHVATSLCSSHRTPLSRPKTVVTTPSHHKAARTMSRHQICVATLFLLPSPKPGRDIKTRSRPS